MKLVFEALKFINETPDEWWFEVRLAGIIYPDGSRRYFDDNKETHSHMIAKRLIDSYENKIEMNEDTGKQQKIRRPVYKDNKVPSFYEPLREKAEEQGKRDRRLEPFSWDDWKKELPGLFLGLEHDDEECSEFKQKRKAALEKAKKAQGWEKSNKGEESNDD